MNISERFLPPPWTAAVVLLCASACINVPAVEPAQAEVRITAPAGTAYTNGVVEVRLDVTGHTPDRVELLKDGEVMAELAPPYTYTWDTAGEAEGTYRLEARAALGDVAYVSANREVVVDRTPPRVVSRVPEPGAQEVWVQSPIRAEFSEPVKQSTVTTESVHLTVGDVAVAHTVSLSEDGKTVTVVPVTQVTAPSTVTLAFSGTVTDLAGNAAVNLGEAWSWAVPEFVPYPTHSIVPRHPYTGVTAYLKLGPSGHPTVLTHRFDGQAGNLFVSRWDGDSWEQLGGGLKTSPEEFTIFSPNLQILPNGNPIIAWTENLGTESSNYIHVAQWNGETWERLGGSEGIVPARPHAWDVALALTSDGRPVVATNMDPEDAEGGIQVYQWTHEQWQRIGPPVYDSLYSVRTPQLALDSLDNPTIALAHPATEMQGRIVVWRWTGSEWAQLGESVNSSANPTSYSSGLRSLLFNSADEPIISWTGSSTGTQDDLFSSIWSNNQWVSLGTPPRTDATSIRTVRGSTLTTNDALLLVSTEYDTLGGMINVHRLENNYWQLVWNSRAAFPGTRTSIGAHSFDADSSGNLALTWTEPREEQHVEIVVYRRNQ
ncbi:Ig-like domain-containing protein [Myxococcus sp. AB036A]|uniref:Ig-like domain-containing protein n=1 Tax=Myxococcus sp. AB036A TaxID=2562793 RepID=UPI001E6136DD|nr:Ig-like domain-containing protein [Myxococcus sp. AB036A]